MTISKLVLIAAIAATLTLQAQAQALSSSGATIVVPAWGEVQQANDQVTATLAVEEQDKNKAAAASRVNQKMNQGIALIKQNDPQAHLKTQGYYTYPVYPDGAAGNTPRTPAGWRIGQTLQVVTSNLHGLPKTIAAAQSVLTLSGLQFGLSKAAASALDAQRIAVTYQNLTERVASIAGAMGRKPSDVVLDSIEFETADGYRQPGGIRSAMLSRAAPEAVQEPGFEPGETTLELRLVGKLHFK